MIDAVSEAQLKIEKNNQERKREIEKTHRRH